VNENLVERFSSEVQCAEAKFFYGFQIMMCVCFDDTRSDLAFLTCLITFATAYIAGKTSILKPIRCSSTPTSKTLPEGLTSSMPSIRVSHLSFWVSNPVTGRLELMLVHRNIVPCIAKKADWALKWISDRRSTFAERLIAFAAVEGIFFSGSFVRVNAISSFNTILTCPFSTGIHLLA
jgi:ribonucleoside-diphosphate reductase subunit M2